MLDTTKSERKQQGLVVHALARRPMLKSKHWKQRYRTEVCGAEGGMCRDLWKAGGGAREVEGEEIPARVPCVMRKVARDGGRGYEKWSRR